ncbi:MAG: hypothetical protein K2G90_07660 [Muribaculaceae bacterium]|nr:hypothetical protein [Muribaculaceae bacterium]
MEPTDNQPPELKKDWATIVHYYVIPALNTILWGISILYLGKIIDPEGIKVLNLEYNDVFYAAFSIYIVFLFEAVIAIFDKALQERESQFNVNVLFYIGGILLNLGVTLWLTYTYLFSNNENAYFVVFIVFMMLIIKYATSFFDNATDLFLVKLHVNVENSTYKS